MRALRVCAVCTAGVVAGTLAGVYLIAAENQPAAAKAPDLQQRVTTLEEKVARLEKQLVEQSQQGYLLTVPPTATPGVAPPLGGRPAPAVPQMTPDVPPKGIPRIFNGQTYYIVPLGKEAAR
jgi:hypothetical protein